MDAPALQRGADGAGDRRTSIELYPRAGVGGAHELVERLEEKRARLREERALTRRRMALSHGARTFGSGSSRGVRASRPNAETMDTATGSPSAAVLNTGGRTIVCESVYASRVMACKRSATESCPVAFSTADVSAGLGAATIFRSNDGVQGELIDREPATELGKVAVKVLLPVRTQVRGTDSGTGGHRNPVRERSARARPEEGVVLQRDGDLSEVALERSAQILPRPRASRGRRDPDVGVTHLGEI